MYPAFYLCWFLICYDGWLFNDDAKTPASYEYNGVQEELLKWLMHVGFQLGELGCLGSLETGMAGEEDGSGAEQA